MTKRILFLAFCCVPVLVFAQDKPFVYDAHGKRDPFSPTVNSSGAITIYDANLSVVDLSLEGIVADAVGNNLAIVNGKIIKKGDVIGPYAVLAITVSEVFLVKDQQSFILKLKKGGL